MDTTQAFVLRCTKPVKNQLTLSLCSALLSTTLISDSFLATADRLVTVQTTQAPLTKMIRAQSLTEKTTDENTEIISIYSVRLL